MLLALALASVLQTSLVNAIGSLSIGTTSGQVIGVVDNSTTPHVAQFLSIPFAEQPIGARRWLPPSPKSRQNATIDATRFGHACPQYETDVNIAPNLYNVDIPEFAITPFGNQGEDCLSLSIWAPWQKKQCGRNSTELLPVVAWFYGGGWAEGGAQVPYQNPGRWVERSGKHIVVSVNYRLSILGFPNAAGLKEGEQNLGLLDQRLGLEWIRDNIASFGGDPERITMWGQSAGAMAADYYNFAYPEDPIVAGYIMHSGTAQLSFPNLDAQQTNFTYVAEHFGCSNSCAETQIDCLRGVNASSIMSFMKTSAENATASLAFSPITDERTHFANYTARAAAGNFSRRPAIIGTNANEGVSFCVPFQPSGPNQTEADAITNGLFLCPTVQTTRERYAANATTFRYLYAGNFSNIAPRAWEGAYHSSDLPLVFGTYNMVRGNATAFQKQVSEKMQDFWFAFAKDPVKGLPKLGWQEYQGGTGEAALIAYDGVVVQGTEESMLEAMCNGSMPMSHHM